MRPFSRGAVTLRSHDPDVPPQVSQRLLSDPRDAKRMLIATRLAEELICEPARAGLLAGGVSAAARPAAAPRQRDRALGALKGLAASAVLGAPSPFRRAIINRAIRPGRLIADQHGNEPLSDAEIFRGLRHHVSSELHLRDRTRGRQDGGRRSALPRLRRARTARRRRIGHAVGFRAPTPTIPTIMIAERVADFIRAGVRSR